MSDTPQTTASTSRLPTGTWVIDPAHSEVGFTIGHLGLSKVRGRFNTFEGSVTTPGELGDATILATVDLASVDTNNEQRDGHLLSSDFFDVESNSTMSFRSTSIDVDGSEGTIAGELTIAATTRTIELDAEFNGTAADPYGVTHAGFSATATVSRKDFGIDFNVPLDAGGFILGDKVAIELEIELVPAQD